MIEPIHETEFATPEGIAEKLNEVIEVVNSLAGSDAVREFIAKLESAAKPADPLKPAQREWVDKYEAAETLPAKLNVLAEVLTLWNVSFYDDVQWDFNSPVYCRNCLYRSQTLLDRMLLNPRQLCAGCAHKAAHG